MKYRLILFLIILPFLVFSQFEGEIEMSTTSSKTKEDATMQWSMKNGKHAMAIESKSESYAMNYDLLINETKKEAWFLSNNNGNKSAYSIPYTKLGESNELDLPLNSKLTEEGYETVAGFNCKKYQIISSTYIVDCWVSDETGITHNDFPSFMNTGDLLGVLKLNKLHGIPVKWEVKNLNGEIILGQYIEKITSKSIADSKFEVPSDYTINGKAN